MTTSTTSRSLQTSDSDAKPSQVCVAAFHPGLGANFLDQANALLDRLARSRVASAYGIEFRLVVESGFAHVMAIGASDVHVGMAKGYAIAIFDECGFVASMKR